MYKFSKNDITGLSIDSHSDVIVKPSKNIGFIEVEVKGSPKNIELVSVKQVSEAIYIIDKSIGTGGSFTITTGNSTMNFSGGNISNICMSNGSISIGGNNSGKIKINGKTINLDDMKEDDEEDIPTIITIYTPSVDLDLSISNSAKFTSDVCFISSIVDSLHSSIVNIASRNLEITSSNSSLIEAEVLGGDLLISSSNSSQINTKGTYASVRINASNSSDVNTKGHCLGNYRANASNSSYICNEAKVDGKKTQSTSNSARIRL